MKSDWKLSSHLLAFTDFVLAVQLPCMRILMKTQIDAAKSIFTNACITNTSIWFLLQGSINISFACFEHRQRDLFLFAKRKGFYLIQIITTFVDIFFRNLLGIFRTFEVTNIMIFSTESMFRSFDLQRWEMVNLFATSTIFEIGIYTLYFLSSIFFKCPRKTISMFFFFFFVVLAHTSQ